VAVVVDEQEGLRGDLVDDDVAKIDDVARQVGQAAHAVAAQIDVRRGRAGRVGDELELARVRPTALG
jgi:hypothetical protein